MWQGGEPLPDPWPYRAFLPLIWFIVGFAVCANAWVEDNLFKRGDHAPSRATTWQKTNIFARRFKAWTRRRRVPAAVWRSFFLYTGLSLILYWCLDFFA